MLVLIYPCAGQRIPKQQELIVQYTLQKKVKLVNLKKRIFPVCKASGIQQRTIHNPNHKMNTNKQQINSNKHKYPQTV